MRFYAPLNSWSVFTEYSNSSSHIILGEMRQRKFAGLGAAYQRRISANRWMSWDYSVELRPLLVESDPTLRAVHSKFVIDGMTYEQQITFSHQVPIENMALYRGFSFSGTVDGQPSSEEADYHFGRRWTYAPAVTPAAFSVHFLPARRFQVFAASSGGFIVSPRDIPVFDSSAFNFIFSFGAGVSWFRDHTHAYTVDYRVQHLSSKSIGYFNPGVDAQFVRVAYSFGR